MSVKDWELGDDRKCLIGKHLTPLAGKREPTVDEEICKRQDDRLREKLARKRALARLLNPHREKGGEE
jgi:hypothetical protein